MTTGTQVCTDVNQAAAGRLLLDAAGVSVRGLGRDNNEDRFYVSPDLDLFVVADGMGGHQAGEIASCAAVDVTIREAPAWTKDASNDELTRSIRQTLSSANRLILSRANRDWECRGAGTTLVLAYRRADRLFVASVGDSRAYRLRGGELERLTVDDSWSEILVRAGAITPEDARTNPGRHVLMTFLGQTDFNADSVAVTALSLAPRDRYLLATDGLHDVLRDSEIEKLLSANAPARVVAERLHDQVVRRDGQDDNTLIVLDVQPSDRQATVRAGWLHSVLQRRWLHRFGRHADTAKDECLRFA